MEVLLGLGLYIFISTVSKLYIRMWKTVLWNLWHNKWHNKENSFDATCKADSLIRWDFMVFGFLENVPLFPVTNAILIALSLLLNADSFMVNVKLFLSSMLTAACPMTLIRSCMGRRDWKDYCKVMNILWAFYRIVLWPCLWKICNNFILYFKFKSKLCFCLS